MAKRASKVELQYRLDMLMGLKAKGHSSSALIKAGQTAWGVSAREVERYLHKIKNLEAQVSLLEPNERLGQIDLKIQYLYSQAMAENNHSMALEILKSQIQLEQVRSKRPLLGGYRANSSPASPLSLPESNELEKLLQLCQEPESA